MLISLLCLDVQHMMLKLPPYEIQSETESKSQLPKPLARVVLVDLTLQIL